MSVRPTRVLSGRERGSASLEMVILAPALLLVLAVLVFAGRLALAQQAVTAAAADAARTASIQRTPTAAATAARTSATTGLTGQGLSCAVVDVRVDAGAFAAPVGVPASVAATVECTVNLADLAIPLIPGSTVVSATMTSPLDTWRERT